MRAPGDILLISCYELGHQPLGIASPLGFLERAGYAPAALDLAVEPLDQEKVVRAKIIGISVPMHTALRLGVQAARRIRQWNPSAHLCFFGLYASLNADYLLEQVTDSVIGGEYETPLVELVEALEEERRGPVNGVSQRRKIQQPYLQHLVFSAPSRTSLPSLDCYAKLEETGSRRLVGYVEASRGCRHLCRHCPIPPVYGGRFFVVPKEIVLDDIGRLVSAGATHITFGDPDFLNGANHSRRIVQALHDAYPAVTFDFTAKIEHILKHRQLFPELGRCGAIFMVSAVESFSDTVLAHLDKGHTRADVFEALAIARDAKIAMRPSLVAFTPWTTIDDYLEVLDVVEREGLIDQIDPVQYAIRLLVPPGSYLLELPAMQAHLGPLNQASFSYEWTHPDPRMDRLHTIVTQAVEAAIRKNEDASLTFYRLKELATAVRDEREPQPVQTSPDPDRARPPRLTEPWFCCAEPMAGQMEQVV